MELNNNQVYMMIDNLRKEIDKYDREILDLLKKRQDTAKSIGLYKKENNIIVYDPTREKEIIKEMKLLATENLNQEMIENIFKEILLASKILQNGL